MKLEDLTVESIAQMTKEQKETFVSTFVKKWPHLANDISNAINFELQVEEFGFPKMILEILVHIH